MHRKQGKGDFAIAGTFIPAVDGTKGLLGTLLLLPGNAGIGRRLLIGEGGPEPMNGLEPIKGHVVEDDDGRDRICSLSGENMQRKARLADVGRAVVRRCTFRCGLIVEGVEYRAFQTERTRLQQYP